MIRTVILLAFLATFACAKPQSNMFEEVITEELRKVLEPLDPVTIASMDNVNMSIPRFETSLLFSFKELSLTSFSDIECTKFTPPILSKHMSISVRQPKVVAHANSYTVDGLLNGQPLSASGASDIASINSQFTISFDVESYSLEPISLCISNGTFDFDVATDGLEANFENADDLNQVLNDHGPELYELWQEYIMLYADDVVALLNKYLCHA